MVNRKNFSGFTLIELLIVILIFGMILAVLIPVSTRSFKNLQLAEVARNIVSVMKYVQNKSISEVKTYVLEFNVEENSYLVGAEKGENREEFEKIKSSLLANRKLPESIKIESLFIKQEDFLDKEKSFIYFYPDGSMDEAELILVSSWGEKLKITTTISGKINVVEE